MNIISKVTGHRISKETSDDLTSIRPGDYWFDSELGYFLICSPTLDLEGNIILGTLRHHSVVEHDDGTISVSPSILIMSIIESEGKLVELFHGFLERGIWTF